MFVTVLACISFLSLGLAAVIYDIREYGWGLYLILLSLVVLTLAIVFWVVGPDEEKQTEKALGDALKMTMRPLLGSRVSRARYGNCGVVDKTTVEMPELARTLSARCADSVLLCSREHFSAPQSRSFRRRGG